MQESTSIVRPRPGDEGIATASYDAQEFGADGKAEAGYMPLSRDDRVKVLSAAEQGHSKNQASSYVYCRRLAGSAGPIDAVGWLPADILKCA